MSTSLFAVIAFSGLHFAKENQDIKIDTQNIAGSYTEIVDNFGFDVTTGMIGVQSKYKDVYSTYSSTLSYNYDKTYTFVDSWQGPTDMTREEKITTGADRKTNFSGGAEAKGFKLAASHTYGSSSSREVKKSFTFPGDNRKHNLYITRTNINTVGYTSRTSYISEPSYMYIWGIAAWNVSWSSYSYCPSRSFGYSTACDTVENLYGNYMN